MSDFLTENGTFFDKQSWSESLDEKFLFELHMEAMHAGRSIKFGDNEIFIKVLDNMQWYMNLEFNLLDIHRRFKLANMRYQTWKGILEHEGVEYDPSTYSVKATCWTWIELCETFELANAYHKVSMERMWPELNTIFGPDEARNAYNKSALPPKPPHAFENIGLDGRPLPTIDEILADFLDEEKRMFERKQKKEQKEKGIVIEYVPADRMSTTKGEGKLLNPSKEIIVISPGPTKNSGSGESSNENVRAKRCLFF